MLFTHIELDGSEGIEELERACDKDESDASGKDEVGVRCPSPRFDSISTSNFIVA